MKLSKEEVRYTPRADDRRHRCGICVHFISDGRCKIVEGHINPDGWCRKFERRETLPTEK